MRTIITITTLLASKNILLNLAVVVSISFRHYSKTEWLNYPLPKDLQQAIYNYKVFENDRKRERTRSFVTISFIIEVLLISIHPIPYFDPTFDVATLNLQTKKSYINVTYRLSDFLLALMFLRIILLVRTIFNYTMFTDIYAKRLW